MNKISLLLIVVAAIITMASCEGNDKKKDIEIKDSNDSVSYAIGMRLYEMYKGDGLDEKTNAEIVVKAFDDCRNDTAILSDEEVETIINNFFMKMQEEQMQEHAKQYESIKKAGEDFLAENAKRPEVKTTASGLQYEVIKEGKGKKPEAKSTVRVNYEGKTIDGKVFDSSYERKEPAEFPLNRVIAGWTEGLQLMSAGSKYMLYIPYNLGYGERGAGEDIPPYSALIFTVELLEIK